MRKFLLVFTFLFSFAGLQNLSIAEDEEVDQNLIASKNKKVGEKEAIGNATKPTNLKDDNTPQDAHDDFTKSIEKEGNGLLTSSEASKIIRGVPESAYKDYDSRNIDIDTSKRRTKGDYKFDISVKKTKETRVGKENAYLRDAYKCFNDENYELAVFYYKMALNENSNNNDSWFGLAVSYQMLLQYDQAIDIYIKLVQRKITNRQKVVNNLLIALNHKSYAEQIDILSSLSQNNKNYGDLIGHLGLVYMRVGEFDKAITVLNKADDLSPSNALIKYNLGLAYDKIGEFEYAQFYYDASLRYDVADYISSEELTALRNRVSQLNKQIEIEGEKAKKENKKKHKK